MSRVTRKREIDAPVGEVWDLVSDPYSLPRWWPRTTRVEGVDLKPEGKRSQWTKVLATADGRGVRADYRCTGSTERQRYAWEQRLEGTPFERHLRATGVEVELRPVEGDRTEVVLTASQTLRGLSRLGSPMMRGAQRRLLEGALDGLEATLGGSE